MVWLTGVVKNEGDGGIERGPIPVGGGWGGGPHRRGAKQSGNGDADSLSRKEKTTTEDEKAER